jgi:hypothetical protein
MKRTIFVSILVIALLLATVGMAAAASRTVYRAGLSGSNSDAHGNSVFIFADDGSQMKFKLVVNGLEDTIMAHIHVAPAHGQNGPPVLWLYPDGPPPVEIEGTFNGLLASATVTEADLTGLAGVTTFEQLRTAIEEGRAYVNVHTTANPGGEIRGDIH